MLNTPWIALLRKVPADQHNQLMLVTTSGIEISVQIILGYEGECIMFKGRLSGCQDAGRLFFVPYDRIDYMGFNRLVGEDEFRSWFGEGSPATASTAGEAPSRDGSNVSNRTPLPNRAALLERIRTRPTTAS